MKSTAKSMFRNYISMIKTFGHVPNGGRIYYAKRSQPLMIIPMMKSYFDVTNDMDFVIENIDVLEVELQYWIYNHNMTINKKRKKIYIGGLQGFVNRTTTRILQVNSVLY